MINNTRHMISYVMHTTNSLMPGFCNAKQSHWEDFLKEMNKETLWTATWYIDPPVAGEGRAETRVPMLRTKDRNGEDISVRSNEDKACVVASSFFPPPPHASSVLPNY